MAGRIRRLLDRFRRSRRSASRRSLLLDDDASGQLEILPASEVEWCRQQFSAIAAFVARHEHPDGGWADMYRRPPSPRRLQDLAVPFAEAEAAMARLLPRFDEVVGGSGSAMTPVPGMRAFGPSPHAGIGLVADAGS